MVVGNMVTVFSVTRLDEIYILTSMIVFIRDSYVLQEREHVYL